MRTQTTTRHFNYTYYGRAISKKEFVSNVPADWMEHVDELGFYSWGGYSANERD